MGLTRWDKFIISKHNAKSRKALIKLAQDAKKGKEQSNKSDKK